MEIINIKTGIQEKPKDQLTVWSFVEFTLFLPIVFLGFLYAKSSVYFRTGKSIGENF